MLEHIAAYGVQTSLGDPEKQGVALSSGHIDPGPGLSYFKTLELVRIALCDLQGTSQQAICQELTALARGTIQGMLHYCIADLTERWGAPSDLMAVPPDLLSWASESLAQEELSYASDADVIFVADLDGSCANGRSTNEFWQRICRRLIAGCKEHQLYEVDPRLRPWGDQGSLVITLTTLEKYWSDHNELWNA